MFDADDVHDFLVVTAVQFPSCPNTVPYTIMKLYLRLFWLVITQSWRERCTMIGPCDTHMRVWPTDLDVFMHVNNGVYLTLMDLGRTDMMLRSGMFGPIRQQGWYPVVVGANHSDFGAR